MTAVYLAGRVGQMRLNHTRKTTEGMSLDMFVMAVTANLAYAGSILVRWGADGSAGSGRPQRTHRVGRRVESDTLSCCMVTVRWC